MVTTCSNCGMVNPDMVSFCSRCGQPFNTPAGKAGQQSLRRCTSCGRLIPTYVFICQYCGKDYRVPDYQTSPQEQISTGTKFGLYVVSLAIPIAGFVIGAIYHGKGDPESKHVGTVCAALGILPLLYVIFILALFFVIIGFGTAP